MNVLDLLVKAIAEDFGDPPLWSAPVEFRHSLALSALNSAYSLRAGPATASNVLARYRAFRPTADTDSEAGLMKAMDSADGPQTSPVTSCATKANSPEQSVCDLRAFTRASRESQPWTLTGAPV